MCRPFSVTGRPPDHLFVQHAYATRAIAASSAEVNQLLAAVEKVKGVHEVVNAPEGHMAGSVPSLQGGSVPHARRADAMRREWSPTTRLVLGTAGVAAAGYVQGVEMCLEAWSLPSASALLLEPQEPGDARVDRIGARIDARSNLY